MSPGQDPMPASTSCTGLLLWTRDQEAWPHRGGGDGEMMHLVHTACREGPHIALPLRPDAALGEGVDLTLLYHGVELVALVVEACAPDLPVVLVHQVEGEHPALSSRIAVPPDIGLLRAPGFDGPPGLHHHTGPQVSWAWWGHRPRITLKPALGRRGRPVLSETFWQATVRTLIPDRGYSR